MPKLRIRGKKCYYCHKRRSFHKTLLQEKGDNKRKAKVEGDATVAATKSEGDIGDILTMFLSQSNKKWILNFRCTLHMCLRRDWFRGYIKVDRGKVLMGNNMSCDVVDLGSMLIKLSNGIIKTLGNVRHVSDL